MPASIESLRPLLLDFDFRRLFVEGLGWDHYPAEPVSVLVNDCEYTLEPVAEKAGFAVYICGPEQDGAIPPYPVRRKVENRISKLAYEHLIVFVDADRTTQIWQWVKRESRSSTVACREQQRSTPAKAGDPVCCSVLRKRSRRSPWTKRPRKLTIWGRHLDACGFNGPWTWSKLTKRFYERFKKELTIFREQFIDGDNHAGRPRVVRIADA